MGGDLCQLCEKDVRFVFDAHRQCVRCLFQELREMPSSRVESGVLCGTCQLNAPTYARAIAGVRFAPPGDQLMRRFKAQGRLTDAGLVARLLWRNMQCAKPPLPVLEALIPIPSSREAILQRGMNPAGEIARELARLSGVPLRGGWLGRTRESSRQKRLNLQARKDSVRGLYAGRVRLQGGWVGLVDDVLTTGSTLEQASEALLQAGAQGVIALVAARTLAK